MLEKLNKEKDQLDELQQAQIVQALIETKMTIVQKLKTTKVSIDQVDEHKNLVKEAEELEKKIIEHTTQVDFLKVQAALTRLGEGVSELIKRKDSGKQAVKE